MTAATVALASSRTTPAGKASSSDDKRSDKALFFLVLTPQFAIGHGQLFRQRGNSRLQGLVSLRQLGRNLIENGKGTLQLLCLGVCKQDWLEHSAEWSLKKGGRLGVDNSRIFLGKFGFSIDSSSVSPQFTQALMAATTETTAGNAPPGNPLERMREAFNRLGIQQKIGFMVALAAIVAIVVGSVLWSQQPDWKVLFSNLSEKDGGAIVTLLEQQNIPHRMSDNGSIQVAANRVHEIRLKMASQGLPRGGMVGFELMENQKFGISQFAEQVNYQRGLEGELARTIMSIGSVQSARVHLAIPKPSVFVRDEQKPTASVMLNLYPGRTLDGGQVAGITHLVSSSVPQLPMANVTVIDQNGALLSQLKSKLTEAGLDPAQNKYIREVEDSIIKRIEEILKPGTRPGKLQGPGCR